MTVIYSNDVLDNLVGTYINPARFDGIERGAELVYTDDAKIKDAYKDTNVEVKPLTEKPKATTKAKEDK